MGDHPSVDSLSTSGKPPLIPNQPPHQKPVPPPGIYVVQLPKDQIFRYPPPENARIYQTYSRRKHRRNCSCRCFCWTFALLGILIFLLATTAGVLYVVYRLKPPNYAVDGVSIRGINVTSGSSISPAFYVTVRANNPNNEIGIQYEKGSSVVVYYSNVKLAGGNIPTFFQPSNNVTLVKAPLTGSSIVLTSSDRLSLNENQKQGKIPLRMNVKALVKIKIGAVTTWRMTVKLKCDVTVDKLTESSKIVSERCKYSIEPW